MFCLLKHTEYRLYIESTIKYVFEIFQKYAPLTSTKIGSLSFAYKKVRVVVFFLVFFFGFFLLLCFFIIIFVNFRGFLSFL